MDKTRFDWDGEKDRLNQEKHGISFSLAQLAFADPKRVIAEDISRKGKKIYEEQNKIYG